MLWEMPCLGSNPSQNSHYSQDKSPNMAKKTFMTLLSVYVCPHMSPFPTSFKLTCFQFFQHVMIISVSSFYTWYSLSLEHYCTHPTHTQTHTHRGKSYLLQGKQSYLFCSPLASNAYYIVAHTPVLLGWVDRQMNEFLSYWRVNNFS